VCIPQLLETIIIIMALATRSNINKDVLDLVFEWTEKIMCPSGDTTNRSSAAAAIQDEPDEDMLDYVFDHVESFTCRDKIAGDRRARDDEYPGVEPSDFTRDNSLVEEGPPMETIRPVRQPRGGGQRQQQRSAPAPVEHTSQQQQLALSSPAPPVDGDNDLIDYVFEHVESFVCADPIEIPPQRTVALHSTKRNVKKAKGQAATTTTPTADKVPSTVQVTPSPKQGHATKTTTTTTTSGRGNKTRRRYYYDEEDEVIEQEDEIQLFFRPETTKAR
jgi:hypothetical protein